MLRTKILTVLALCVVLGLTGLVPAPARAASITEHDTDRTQGRLDLESVTLVKQGRRIVATVRTYEGFGARDIGDLSTIGVRFKINGTEEREANLVRRAGRLRGRICTYTRGAAPMPRDCSPVAIVKPAARSVVFTIPVAAISPGARVFRFRAGSFALSGEAGCDAPRYCQDNIPNRTRQFLRWTP